MGLSMRFRQQGRRNARTFRAVVADKKAPRDGKYIANVGHYDPKRKIWVFHKEGIIKWMAVGAQLTENVRNAVKRIYPEIFSSSVSVKDREKGCPSTSSE